MDRLSLFPRMLALVVVAVLPAIGILLFNQFELRQAALEQQHHDALRLLTLLEAEQARTTEGARQVLGTLAETGALRENDVTACQGLLERVGQQLSNAYAVDATDASGTIVCSSDAARVGEQLVFSGSLGQSASGQATEAAAVNFNSGRLGGERTLPISLPYSGADGQPLGFVTISLKLSSLASHLVDQPMAEGAVITVADRSGTVLARLPDDGGWVGRSLPPPYLKLLDLPQAAVIQDDTGDRPETVAYLPAAANPSGMFMSVALDNGAVLGVLNTVLGQGSLLVVAGIAATAVVAWLLYRLWLAAPANMLLNTVDRWRLGDYDARVHMRRALPEIDQLAQAFNRMAEELQLRERVREALHAAEARMAAVLTSITDGVLEVNRDGDITFMNPQATRLLGSSRRAVGTQLFDALPHLRHSRFEKHILRAMQTQEPCTFEDFHETTGRWYGVRVFPSLAGLAVYLQDITDRQQSQQALTELTAELSALLMHAPVGFAFFDRNHRIVRLNDQLADLIGLPASNHLGQQMNQMLPDIAGVCEKLVTKVFAAHEPVVNMVMSGRVPGTGEVRHWLAGFYPVIVEGDARYVGAVMMDITAQKRTEQQASDARDEAERANRAKSRFFAAASHDLRQPAQALVLLASALENLLKDHKAAPVVSHLKQAVEALTGLLEGLLDVSRLDAGVITPDIHPVELGSLLQSIAADFRLTAEGKGLSLRAVGCDYVVLTDPTLLARVVRNLLDNAVRYTKSGGVLVGCRNRNGRRYIEIHDTGPGIAADDQAAVFDEFVQLANPERDRRQGLGLGLAIVRRLSDLLGHELSLESTPGKGSVFRLDVGPAVASPLPDCGNFPEEVADNDLRGTVLIVDDEVIVRQGIRAVLESWGLKVVEASSVDEAVDAACDNPPTVILADYRLRGTETGLAVISAVRHALRAEIPAYVVSGDTAPSRLAEIERSGLKMLHKPVPAQVFREAVEAALFVHR